MALNVHRLQEKVEQALENLVTVNVSTTVTAAPEGDLTFATTVDLVQGDITREINHALLDPKYDALRADHDVQVTKALGIIDKNLATLQAMARFIQEQLQDAPGAAPAAPAGAITPTK